MRTILFRGKRLDNGNWVYGDYFEHITAIPCFTTDDPKIQHFIIRDGFCDWHLEPPINYIEVDPDTVGQYTGLLDRNGKYIFEGDLVQYYSQVRNELLNEPCLVRYGEFNCTCCNGVYGWEFENGDIRDYEFYEVVGNIYDNQELLGEVN